MPVLKNSKHELFAQEMVKGKSATEAMAAAGYSDPRNSTRLTKNDEIRARIDELQARAADGVVISRQWVIERLVENVDRSMRAEEVKDTKGRGTGEYRYEGSVANRALELVGKEIGMFKDKVELSGKDGGPVETADVSTRDLAKALLAALSRKDDEEAG